MATSQSLNIAIIGAGQIGSTFAYYLSAANHQVTLIARPNSERLRQLQAANAVVMQDGKQAKVTVADHLDETIQYDLLLVTLRMDLVDSVLPCIHCSGAKQVMFMFSSFTPEYLVPTDSNKARYLLGFPYFTAWLNGEGRLAPRLSSKAVISNSQKWVQVFHAAGMGCEYVTDMHNRIRSQSVVGSTMEAVCYTAKQHNGGATWAEAMLGARAAHEGFALIKRLGYPVESTMNRSVASMPATMIAAILYAVTRVTSVRDLMAGGIGESRAMVGAMMKAAEPQKLTYLPAMINSK